MPVSTSEKALRRMRHKIFDYPPEQEARADRVLAYLKTRVMRQRRDARLNAPVGPYSGLTRRELAMTGTCETDWY